MNHDDKQIDLSIPTQTCSSTSNCDSIKRLSSALSYYDKLNPNDNDNGKISFCEFMNEKYGHRVYDDFYHLSHEHQTDIKSIMNLAITQYEINQCSLSECNHSNRLFRVNQVENKHEHERKNDDNNDDLKYFELHKETMDTLQFYIHHLLSSGLRFIDNINYNIPNQETKDDDNDADTVDSPYFDPLFDKMSKFINKSRDKTSRFKRFAGNKYNISSVKQINTDKIGKQTSVDESAEISEEPGDTFLDDIYSTMPSIILSDIIKLNGYDTESLFEDIKIYKNNGISNISIEYDQYNKKRDDIWFLATQIMAKHYKYLSKEIFMSKLVEIMDKTTIDIGVFAVGIDWKYSDHSDTWTIARDNKYKHSEYRVHPHYADLKEEMINYPYLAIKEVNKIIKKANVYLNTTTARSFYFDSDDLENLITIILYCDYSNLSTDFTSSFRKSHQFQTVKQIKQKNSKYYHWSKILRDTIRDYGKSNRISLSGPFYCGMSVLLNISQFNMFIHSPLSTSVHIEVAMKFSGEDGMILEMDNTKGFAVWLKGLDVSWISRYKEEDERLFFGCKHAPFGEIPINIWSIRHISTATNYQEIIQAMTAFDNIISGNVQSDFTVPTGAHSIISHLLSDENKNKFSPFIYQTFKVFMDKKKEVTLNVSSIHVYIKDIKFSGCMFGEKGFELFEYRYDNKYFIPEDTKNIPVNIINKFDSIETVNMESTQNGDEYSSLSLFCLLSLLEPQSTIKQINIKGYKRDRIKISWLWYVWNRDSFSLKQQYQKKGYIIDYKEESRFDIISINKK